jgi:hypothetical protein
MHHCNSFTEIKIQVAHDQLLYLQLLNATTTRHIMSIQPVSNDGDSHSDEIIFKS